MTLACCSVLREGQVTENRRRPGHDCGSVACYREDTNGGEIICASIREATYDAGTSIVDKQDDLSFASINVIFTFGWTLYIFMLSNYQFNYFLRVLIGYT